MSPPAPHLVDEILEEIFLRLPTPQALARTACASPSFRRIVTQRSFLRRFRNLHPPPLLGFVTAGEGGFAPDQEPHPSAPIARALADAADFTYSFVPDLSADGGSFTAWSPCDIRDGRVLLESPPRFLRTYASTFSTTLLAVCDPLSRRYVLLPHIPVDLYQQGNREKRLYHFQHRLAPTGKDDEDETSFRVICWVHFKDKMVVIVFSSASGQWSVAATPSWSSLGLVNLSWRGPKNRFKNSCGCFYWTDRWKGDMIVMDTRTMEFSTANILDSDHMQVMNLPEQSKCTSAVVVPTEGAFERFTVVYSPNGSFHLYHTTQQSNDGSCQLKVVVPLPRGSRYYTVCATDGFVFLQGIPDQAQSGDLIIRISRDLHQLLDLFSLEVKTSQLKKVCGPAPVSKCLHSYFVFPPSMSKPSL